LRLGTVLGSILLGIFGFLLLLTIILSPFGLILMVVAFVLFIYGLAASAPKPPAQVVTVSAPVQYGYPAMIHCPQCRNLVAADANYCPKCGADVYTRAKEVIKEKEVIVKLRCPYCNRLYNETEDSCPYCGGKR
jgi:RNA polymerase subunit RPABC4/transcription elongation factor Spt4